jgi:hypothetical protein
MTFDQAAALSLVPDLSRVGLTARLQSDDPELTELATQFLPEAARRSRPRPRRGRRHPHPAVERAEVSRGPARHE